MPFTLGQFLKGRSVKKKKKTTIKPPSAIVETRLSENKIAFLEVSLTKCFTSEPRRRKEIESCSFFINGVTYATKHNGEINIPSGTQCVLKNKKWFNRICILYSEQNVTVCGQPVAFQRCHCQGKLIHGSHYALSASIVIPFFSPLSFRLIT